MDNNIEMTKVSFSNVHVIILIDQFT